MISSRNIALTGAFFRGVVNNGDLKLSLAIQNPSEILI